VTTISAVRQSDGIGYTHQGPGFTMKTRVPLVFEKLESQLAADQVYWAEREKFITDLNVFGAATVSFPARDHKFHC
jgi:hypothetical protein